MTTSSLQGSLRPVNVNTKVPEPIEEDQYEEYNPEIDGTFCNYCGKPLDAEGYCPDWEKELRPEFEYSEDMEYDPHLHGSYCNYCGGLYFPDGTCPKCDEPEPEPITIKSKTISYGSWKVHAIVLVAYVLITTPLTWYMCLYSPEANAFIDALTNTSNMVALAYAVYIYYLYDETKREAIQKAKAKGIDVPNLDEALGMIYTKFKAFDTWFESNKHELQEIEKKFNQIDMSQMLNSLEELSKIAVAIKDSGMSTEDMAEFLHYMPKAMDRLKQFIDEEETKLSDIPDDCLRSTSKN